MTITRLIVCIGFAVLGLSGAVASAFASDARWCESHGLCPAIDALAARPVGQADVHAIYFRADWCANCHIIERRLADENILQVWQERGDVSLIVVDLTAPQSAFDAAVDAIFARNQVWAYNAYLGLTGFITVAPAGADKPLTCLTRVHARELMLRAPDDAAALAWSQADPAPAPDLLCPPPRNRS